MAKMGGLVDKGLLAQFWEEAKGRMGGGCPEELLLALLPATSGLEDLAVRAGSFANAGAGWNTYVFPEPFEGVPFVAARCDGHGVDVKGATADRFLYRVTNAASGAASYKTLYSYATGYTSNKRIAYVDSPSTSAERFAVLTGVGASGTVAVADAVEIRWMAIEYGGEQ